MIYKLLDFKKSSKDYLIVADKNIKIGYFTRFKFIYGEYKKKKIKKSYRK